MKQGRASRDVSESYKRDPHSHAINEKGVSQIGQNMGNHVTGKGRIMTSVPQPVHAGRGFTSPLGTRGTPGVGGGGRTIHKSGSQGSR